ncbi:5'-methylthioadenosine/S-adenosylhomocysteine nucleosidase family protein [Streptacidiphilus cavernicola]|uniref:1-hydroxy-2-methyl-2-butenyl 4-diphosphate reductase n=1 Tax=Streptacidiphilus cavernicola TaxID=3342716 RepID=A0ABV6W659_9ACTN
MSTEPPRADGSGPAGPGPLLLACALTAEQAALRAGVRAASAQGTLLLRTGMGQQRARRSVSGALAQGAQTPGAFLFAGFGAAVGPGIRPGDVLVATEVRDADSGSIDLPCPDALAGALRRAGLTVHTGPLFSSDRVVRGDRRAALHAEGVLGVEMETAGALTALAGGIPAAAVRVVVDTPEHELLRPGILLHGLRAWRALRTAAPVLAGWHVGTTVGTTERLG